MTTASKADLTPDDLINMYKINGTILSDTETKDFFDKFYENSKTFPQEFTLEWVDGFGLNLEKNSIDELRKNVNEKTAAVFVVDDAYYIYSLKNTIWVYFVVNSNLDPIDRYIKEYTGKEKDRYKEWYVLTSSDELVEKSQVKSILEDFYKVQKKTLSMDMKIRRAGYFPQNFSDIINEFDPGIVKDPNRKGILNEENTIIVHRQNASTYKEKISNYTGSLLLMYRLEDNDAFINRRPIVLDEKTLRIIYADFGGSGYIYEKIEYLNS